MIYITRKKKFLKSFMTICFKKNMQMLLLSQNGKKKDLKNCVVCNAFKKLIDNSEQHAFAEFQKTT